MWPVYLKEKIKMPKLYIRTAVKYSNRNGVYLAWAPFMKLKPTEKVLKPM